MIKECRFMEDAHLSAARNQASIPLTIDFHSVRRVSCPPFRFVSPGATIEIINGTTESRFVQIVDPSTFRCELVYLFFFARKIIVPRNTSRNDVDR